MSAIGDLEEALERCINEEKTGARVLSIIVDFLAEDDFWTIHEIGPVARARLVGLVEKMKEWEVKS